MELSEVILALVAAVSSISAWVVTNLVSDVRALNDKMTSCQTNMPKEYMLKADYISDAQEIKFELREQRKLIDQIWKTIRIDVK
jgi:hypothetical protein